MTLNVAYPIDLKSITLNPLTPSIVNKSLEGIIVSMNEPILHLHECGDVYHAQVLVLNSHNNSHGCFRITKHTLVH